jgi:hypothetical protein
VRPQDLVARSSGPVHAGAMIAGAGFTRLKQDWIVRFEDLDVGNLEGPLEPDKARREIDSVSIGARRAPAERAVHMDEGARLAAAFAVIEPRHQRRADRFGRRYQPSLRRIARGTEGKLHALHPRL